MNHEDIEVYGGLTYMDARRDGGALHLQRVDIQSETNLTRVSSETRIKLINIGALRPTYHLIRMLKPGRSEAEFIFATDFADYLSSISWHDLDKKVKGVLGNEGCDTAMWWTYTPYIYKHLRARGLEKSEALVKLLDWAKTGESVSSGGDFTYIHLIGLEAFNKYRVGNLYALSDNPMGASHVFTDLKAAEIVRDIFKV